MSRTNLFLLIIVVLLAFFLVQLLPNANHSSTVEAMKKAPAAAVVPAPVSCGKCHGTGRCTWPECVSGKVTRKLFYKSTKSVADGVKCCGGGKPDDGTRVSLCIECHGTGKCPHCGGTGVEPEKP